MQKKVFSVYIPGTDFNNYQSNAINGWIDCNVILAGMFHKWQVVDQDIYIYTYTYIYMTFYYFFVLLNQSLTNFNFSPIINRIPQESLLKIFWYSKESGMKLWMYLKSFFWIFVIIQPNWTISISKELQASFYLFAPEVKLVLKKFHFLLNFCILNFKYFSTSSLGKMEMTVCDLLKKKRTLYNFSGFCYAKTEIDEEINRIVGWKKNWKLSTSMESCF